MPKGVYIRTEEHKQTLRKNLEKARGIACKLPITQKQRKARSMNGRKMGLAAKGKSNPHKGNIFADNTIKHHNDLCHGAERPDDVTLMTSSEHMSLHNNLRVKDGSNPFLAQNRK